MKLSARTLYLSLAFCITLLFTATGIYYLVTSSAQQQIDSIEIEDHKLAQAKSTPEPTTLPTPTPIPTPTPTPTPTSEPEIEESTDTEKLGNFLDEMEKTCYEPCEFSYQCPANLDCISVNNVKVCANPQCEEDITCTCTATPTPEPIDTGIGGPEDKVKGLLTSNEASSSDELDDFNEVAEIYVSEAEEDVTTTTTTTKYEVADLPEAGVPELTVLLLLVGVALSVLGFTWLK